MIGQLQLFRPFSAEVGKCIFHRYAYVRIVSSTVCLFGVYRPTREFSVYGDVIITGDWLPILGTHGHFKISRVFLSAISTVYT